MGDIRQSPFYASYLSRMGWKVEIIKGNYYFIRQFPILGSFIKAQRVSHVDFDDLDFLAKKYRAFKVLLEPVEELDLLEANKRGFLPLSEGYIPTKTLVLKLNKKLDDIYSSLPKDTRYSLRKSSKIKVNRVFDIREFYKIWKKANRRRHAILPYSNFYKLVSSFPNGVALFISEDNDAGGVFIRHGDIVYYWLGFSGEIARRNCSHYQVLWKAIEWAKKSGAGYFDFEGVYDERFPKQTWIGFSRFKKGFLGNEIYYSQAFEKKYLWGFSSERRV